MRSVVVFTALPTGQGWRGTRRPTRRSPARAALPYRRSASRGRTRTASSARRRPAGAFDSFVIGTSIFPAASSSLVGVGDARHVGVIDIGRVVRDLGLEVREHLIGRRSLSILALR